ncbi:hypothetical protein BGZ63DRAFT_418107 [Mariannaea sp. PMI_226]|nr:hypothetical protein BGZ63DRAFT_418107 [Mariannaea sp. PMI_226]
MIVSQQYRIGHGLLAWCIITNVALLILVYFQVTYGRWAIDKSLSTAELFAELWKPLKHPLNNPTFITDKGVRFDVPSGSQRWLQPLGKRVVLIDADSRLSETAPGTLLNKEPLDFTGLLGATGGHLNHYLYALIHGYDYRLIRAADYPDRHGTWVKPAIIKEALKTHDFVICLDSDAVFTNLHLPIEWLMNLWDVTPETLIAMAYDLDNQWTKDGRGNLILNTGFIIAQASQRNQEMFEVWEDCPNRIPGCDNWKENWAHEQSAFSWYIRYEFNGTDEVKNIPCDHANGNEYYDEGHGACQGVFVSHNWQTKDKTAEILGRSTMKTIVRRLHEQFQADKNEVFVDASDYTYPVQDIPI